MLRLALEVVAAAGALGGLFYYALAFAGARRFRRRPALAGFTPPVSILKPLHGLDPHAEECLRSHCLQDYPQYELIFGVDHDSDAAVPLVQQLRGEFPDREIRLVVCPVALGANRKVSNLVGMLREARHEYVLMNDADIRVPPDYLRRVMREFADQRVGLVTALYRGIPGQTFASRLEAAGIADFAAGVLAALVLERNIGFALGSTIALPKAALQQIGGLEPLVDHLADDYELGARAAGAGYQVVLADMVVETALPDYTLREFFQHQLRWARTIRGVRPGRYFLSMLSFGLPWALLGVIVSAGAAWAWALLALVAATRLTVTAVVSRLLEAPVRDLWLAPLRDLLGLVIWAASYASSVIHWRGQRFVLKQGKLTRA